MPQAIPFIVNAAATAGALSATATFVLTAGAALAVGVYERDRAKQRARDAYNAQLQDRIVTLRSGIAPRVYVLGTCRVTGTMIYGDSVGPNKTALDVVTALAANQCDLIGHYLDDEYIAVADFPGDKFGKLEVREIDEVHVVTGPSDTITLAYPPRSSSDCKVYRTAGARAVQQHSFSLGSGSDINITGLPGGDSTVRVVYKALSGLKLESHFITGSDSEAAHSWSVTTPLWTSDHRARGICGLRTLYRWDEDIYSERGAPAHGAVLRGGTLDTHPLYDPRDESNPLFSSNPAILTYWLATLPRDKGGCGMPAELIPVADVIEAANICDELVTVKKLDGSGYEQIKRYEFNGTISTADPPRTNRRIIEAAMNGKMLFTAGGYRMRAGAFRSATLTITDDDVVGTESMLVSTGGDIDTPPNAVTATFADATKHWRPDSPASVRNEDYITSDGHEEPLDLSFPGTTDPRQARYLMGIALESMRPALGVKLRVGGIGEDIALLDTVELDLTNRSAFAGKTFEVVDRVDNWDGTFDLELSEIKASTWALDPDDYTPVDPPATGDASFLWNVAPPTGFGVTQGTPQVLPDGTTVARLNLAWDTPTQEYVVEGGQHNIRYRRIGSNGQWVALAPVPGDATSTTITAALEFDDFYQFQIQAQNGLGARSEWVDAFEQITGDPAGTIVGLLTNEAHTLPADSAGNVSSYAGASGSFVVYHGTTDVSSLFTLSTQANPQGLTVGYTDQAYSVTGGLGAGEAGATLTIRASGTGAYTGVTIDKVFSLGKSVAGTNGTNGANGTNGTNGTNGVDGDDGADAKLLYVIADRQTIAYDGAGNPSPSSQTTTFTAQKVNTSAVVSWSLTDIAGNPLTPVGSYLSSGTGDSVSMTRAQFDAALAVNGTRGVIVTATLTDGVTLSDKISVLKVQAGADGSNGSNGAPGADGDDGADAKLLFVISDRQTIAYDGTGSPTPSTQTTTFTAQKQNTSATVSWTISDLLGNVLTPATYLSATTGDSVTMTRANFDAAIAVNGATGVIVTGTLTDGVTLSDSISVVKVQNGASGVTDSALINDGQATAHNPTTGTPTASFSVKSDGTVDHAASGTSTFTSTDYTWKTGAGAAGDYQVRAVPLFNEGSLKSGSSSTNSWLACSTTRTWTVERTADGTARFDLEITIRSASTGLTLSSGVVTIQAVRGPL